MSGSKLSTDTTHHLVVHLSKHVFLHKSYGFLSALTPLEPTHLIDSDLAPVMVISLCVEDAPIRWHCYVSESSTTTISEFFHRAYGKDSYLRGIPTVLKLSPQIAERFPTIQSLLGQYMEVVVRSSKDKKYTSSVRECYKAGDYPLLSPDYSGPMFDEVRYTQRRQADDQFTIVLRSRETDTQGKIVKAHQTQSKRPLSSTYNDSTLWTPFHESFIPIHHFPPVSTVTYLQTPNHEWYLIASYGNREEIAVHSEEVAELVRELMVAWPSKPKQVADSCGMSVKELDWYLSGKQSVSTSQCQLLCAHFNIERHIDRRDKYCKTSDVSYFLSPSSPNNLEAVFDMITHGGDYSDCVELVPSSTNSGAPHFLVVSCYGIIHLLRFTSDSNYQKALYKDSLIATKCKPIYIGNDALVDAAFLCDNYLEIEHPSDLARAFVKKHKILLSDTI